MFGGTPIDRGPHDRNATSLEDGNGFLVYVPEYIFSGRLRSQVLSCLGNVFSMRSQNVSTELLVPWVFWVISEGIFLANPAAVPLTT